jgi:hypothetical protein
MYPEEVYDCGLPLPYELLRPIAFQVAYEHIKEKLKFPLKGEFNVNTLIIKEATDEDMQSIWMRWAQREAEIFFFVQHITYINSGNSGDNRRTYKQSVYKGVTEHTRLTIEKYCEQGFDF